MCLSTLRENYPGKGKTLIAYKQFRRNISNGSIIGKYRSTSTPWRIGIEKGAGTKRVITNKGRHFQYPAGFHAYTKAFTRSDQYTLWARVRLRGIHTKGTQGHKIVYVARYCKILELLP